MYWELAQHNKNQGQGVSHPRCSNRLYLTNQTTPPQLQYSGF